MIVSFASVKDHPEQDVLLGAEALVSHPNSLLAFRENDYAFALRKCIAHIKEVDRASYSRIFVKDTMEKRLEPAVVYQQHFYYEPR